MERVYDMGLKRHHKILRGWLPQEPNLMKMQRTELPPVPVNRHSTGVRVIGVVFLLFGIICLMSLFLQFGKFSYLPVSTQVLLIAPLASVLVITAVIGGGLLTEKNRWIKAAIVFFVVSLIVFYIIPLRAAFPLEVVLIIYLGYLRRDAWLKKRAATIFSTVVMTGVICLALLTPLPLVNAQSLGLPNHEVAEIALVGSNGNLHGTVSVYQYNDSDNQHDYYLVKANVFVWTRGELNFVNANFSFSPQETVQLTYVHTPQSNPAPSLTIGFTLLSFNIGNPRTVYVYSSPSSVRWVEETDNQQRSETFSTELIVPQEAHFNLSFSADAGHDTKIFGYLWHDSLTLQERTV